MSLLGCSLCCIGPPKDGTSLTLNDLGGRPRMTNFNCLGTFEDENVRDEGDDDVDVPRRSVLHRLNDIDQFVRKKNDKVSRYWC